MLQAANPTTRQPLHTNKQSSQHIQQRLKDMPQQCQASVLVLGHVLHLISTEELQDAVHNAGPCALIVGNGPAAHINTDMISKVKRKAALVLHSDRAVSCTTFLQEVYKEFNSRISELTQLFPNNDEGYRAYQAVLFAEREAASAFLGTRMRLK